MSKIYFSRSISRTMSADHPVGDPTGGAAYGEKNDPVSAAFSIAAMYGSAGAMMAGSIVAGITFAGAAVSLVGNVTGNKTLSKIGMIAGIAGGIGQMGGFGDAVKNAKWGDSFSTTTQGPTFTSNTTNAPGNQAVGNQAQGTITASDQAARNAEVANQTQVTSATRTQMAGPDGNISGTAGQAAPSNAAFNQGGRVAPVDANAARFQGYTEVANTAAAGQTGADWRYYTNNAGSSIATDPAGRIFQDGTQVTGAGGGSFGAGDYANMAWQGTKDIGSSIMDFTKENPYGAMMIGQTAQPIADYLSGKTDAEIEALEAQTGYADAKALQLQEEIAREKMRRQNLSAGYMNVDTGITVNPSAGLISQQMPRG